VPTVDQIDASRTELPLVLNIVNHFKDKYGYFAVDCRMCGSRDCQNCPLIPDEKFTLLELLEKVCHKTKFQMNDSLFAHN